jgi:hypothetical protein
LPHQAPWQLDRKSHLFVADRNWRFQTASLFQITVGLPGGDSTLARHPLGRFAQIASLLQQTPRD